MNPGMSDHGIVNHSQQTHVTIDDDDDDDNDDGDVGCG